MPESNEVLSVLQQIEEKDYNNVAEVTKASRLGGRITFAKHICIMQKVPEKSTIQFLKRQA